MVEAEFLIICLTMFVGSYIAGLVPLFFTLNERRIRLTSIFGAGLLVGTALCVIIPEGISTIYSSYTIPLTEELPFLKEKTIKNLNNFLSEKVTIEPAENNNINNVKRQINHLSFSEKQQFNKEIENANWTWKRNAVDEISIQSHKKKVSVKGVDAKKLEDIDELHHHQQDNKRKLPNFNRPIGISLTIGFLFMFVIQQYSKSSQAGRIRSVPTLGFVIHAAADGIAMGSASTSHKSDIQFIVFLAIMLHKAPSAFALVSILIVEGLEKTQIKQHLLIFSLSAPLSTLFTYNLLSNVETQAYSTPYVTGFILLFSAGTFLYIAAAHVLPELVEAKYTIGSIKTHFTVLEIGLFVCSALLPTFLSFSSHEH